MPFDLPDQPVLDEIVTTPDGTVYVWDGTMWRLQAVSGAYVPLDGSLPMTGPLSQTDGTETWTLGLDGLAPRSFTIGTGLGGLGERLRITPSPGFPLIVGDYGSLTIGGSRLFFNSVTVAGEGPEIYADMNSMEIRGKTSEPDYIWRWIHAGIMTMELRSQGGATLAITGSVDNDATIRLLTYGATGNNWDLIAQSPTSSLPSGFTIADGTDRRFNIHAGVAPPVEILSTGELILALDPTSPMGAVTKQYADGLYLNVLGDTMTGDLGFTDGTQTWTATLAGATPGAFSFINDRERLVIEPSSIGLPTTIRAEGSLTIGGTSLYFLGNELFAGPCIITDDFGMHFLADNPAFQWDWALTGIGNVAYLHASRGGAAQFILSARDPDGAAITFSTGTAAWSCITEAATNINPGAFALAEGDFSLGERRFRILPGAGLGIEIDATGMVSLLADPTLPLHAATKQYVDANAGGGGLPLTGGTLTGDLILTDTADLVVNGYTTAAGQFTLGGRIWLSYPTVAPLLYGGELFTRDAATSAWIFHAPGVTSNGSDPAIVLHPATGAGNWPAGLGMNLYHGDSHTFTSRDGVTEYARIDATGLHPNALAIEGALDTGGNYNSASILLTSGAQSWKIEGEDAGSSAPSAFAIGDATLGDRRLVIEPFIVNPNFPNLPHAQPITINSDSELFIGKMLHFLPLPGADFDVDGPYIGVHDQSMFFRPPNHGYGWLRFMNHLGDPAFTYENAFNRLIVMGDLQVKARRTVPAVAETGPATFSLFTDDIYSWDIITYPLSGAIMPGLFAIEDSSGQRLIIQHNITAVTPIEITALSAIEAPGGFTVGGVPVVMGTEMESVRAEIDRLSARLAALEGGGGGGSDPAPTPAPSGPAPAPARPAAPVRRPPPARR